MKREKIERAMALCDKMIWFVFGWAAGGLAVAVYLYCAGVMK